MNIVSELRHHPDPSVCYLALRDLAQCAPGSATLREAQTRVLESPPVRAILRSQYPAGYWMHPDLGIAPHYRATVWQVLFLAQFGVGRIQAVEHAVDFVLAHNRDAGGAFRLHHGRGGRSPALTGALLWALARLGFVGDARLDATWAWLAGQINANAKAGTATWVLRAAAAWRQTARVAGVENVLRAALIVEINDLPPALTFPLALQVDRLAALEALAEAGLRANLPPRARAWLLEKRDARGYWPLERVPGRMWYTGDVTGAANPWITIRALKVLQATGEPAQAT